jgi:hypothetical protein
MMNKKKALASAEIALRFKQTLAGLALAFAVAACSRDSSTAKTDSAAADSIRDAQSVPASTAPAAGSGSASDSAQGPINSTEGTIGETRKRARMHTPDTTDADSVLRNRTSDALGPIKR